jgi:phosphate ABC transporter phosphate-binding protein
MKTTHTITVAIVAIAVVLGGAIAYMFLSGPNSANSQATVEFKGAGATFPYPLLNAIITKYTTQVRTNVHINYQSIGSGGGISALESKTVDFAASDAPLTASDMASAPNTLHIPETIGAVTLAYNLPGISSGLHLTGKIIADIFLGTITMWNDSAIQSINTNTSLPERTITTIHRSDGSGTTFIFTSYLSLSSQEWNSTVGKGKSVAWPGGIGSNGNTGVASTVNGTQYSIGYVELAYALQNGMTVAAIQNSAGNWIQPSLTSTQAAVESGAAIGLPAGDASWVNVSLLNTPGANSYPIVSFTYLLVYKELNVIPGMTQERATALVQFLWYIIQDGQQLAQSLAYAQLPTNVIQVDEATIQSITFNAQHLPTS